MPMELTKENLSNIARMTRKRSSTQPNMEPDEIAKYTLAQLTGRTDDKALNQLFNHMHQEYVVYKKVFGHGKPAFN